MLSLLSTRFAKSRGTNYLVNAIPISERFFVTYYHHGAPPMRPVSSQEKPCIVPYRNYSNKVGKHKDSDSNHDDEGEKKPKSALKKLAKIIMSMNPRFLLMLAVFLFVLIYLVYKRSIDFFWESRKFLEMQERYLLENHIPMACSRLPPQLARTSEQQLLTSILKGMPHRLIIVTGPMNSGKSTLVKSSLYSFPYVAYINFSKYADVSSVDDLVYALTEEFPVWSKPSVGKDIRKVMELIGPSLPKDAPSPRAFSRRDLMSLLRSFEGVIAYHNRTHPGNPPIFFADEGQALSGLLRRADTPAGEEAYQALKDVFAWLSQMAKSGQCHVVIACTSAFHHKLVQTQVVAEEYYLPVYLSELGAGAAFAFMNYHGVRGPQSHAMYSRLGGDLGLLDEAVHLQEHLPEESAFTNIASERIFARINEKLELALSPERIPTRVQSAQTNLRYEWARWTPGQWWKLMNLLCSPDHAGMASYLDLVLTHCIPASSLQSMLDFELVSYRPSKGFGTDMQNVKGSPPYITAPGRAHLLAMKEFLAHSDDLKLLRVYVRLRGDTDEPIRTHLRQFTLPHARKQIAQTLRIPESQIIHISVPGKHKITSDGDLIDLPNDTLLEVTTTTTSTSTASAHTQPASHSVENLLQKRHNEDSVLLD